MTTQSKRYLIYDSSTGEIKRQVYVSSDQEADDNTGAGESYLEHPSFVDQKEKKVDTVSTTVVDKLTMSPTVTQSPPHNLVFSGYADIDITGLPVGWELKSQAQVSIESQTATTIQVRLSGAKTFSLLFKCLGYKDHVLSITTVDNRGSAVPVTLDDIRAKRDEFEEDYLDSDVDATTYTWDADTKSLQRMKEQLDNLVNLPTLNASSELQWHLPDGTGVWVTETELQTVYDDLMQKKAERRATLHDQYITFKNDWTSNPENVTAADIDTQADWGL